VECGLGEECFDGRKCCPNACGGGQCIVPLKSKFTIRIAIATYN